MAEHPRSTGGPRIAARLTVSDERLRGIEAPGCADPQPSPRDEPPADEPRAALEPPLTIAEVARHYRMSERTVRRRIKDGTLHKELGGGRLVRISVEQLRKLAARRE